MTLDELKAMYAAMTPGEWETASNGVINCGGKTLAEFSVCVPGWVLEELENRDGIVALHNAFPALVERYEAMRAALAYYANKSNYASKLTPGGGSWYMEIELDDGDRAIEAIADADKPLESRS